MARKATADSTVKQAQTEDADNNGETATLEVATGQCPVHGAFETEVCQMCASHIHFTSHERVRMMLMEAALHRAEPYLAQRCDAARSDPGSFPKVHDDYLAIRQAIEFVGD